MTLIFILFVMPFYTDILKKRLHTLLFLNYLLNLALFCQRKNYEVQYFKVPILVALETFNEIQ